MYFDSSSQSLSGTKILGFEFKCSMISYILSSGLECLGTEPNANSKTINSVMRVQVKNMERVQATAKNLAAAVSVVYTAFTFHMQSSSEISHSGLLAKNNALKEKTMHNGTNSLHLHSHCTYNMSGSKHIPANVHSQLITPCRTDSHALCLLHVDYSPGSPDCHTLCLLHVQQIKSFHPIM